MLWIVGWMGLQQCWCQTGVVGLPGESAGGRQSSFLVMSSYPVSKTEGLGQLMLQSERRYFSGLNRMMLAGSCKLGTQRISAGMDQTGNGAMFRTHFWTAFGVSFSEKTMAGIRIGWQQQKARGYGAQQGISAGLGCAFQVSDQMEWRFQGDGLESFWQKGVTGSYRIRSMLYYECSSLLGLSGEVFLEEQQTPVVSAGIHYAFAERCYARAAMYSNLGTMSISAGFHWAGLQLEVTSVWHQLLSMSGSLGVGYRFTTKP